MSSDILPSPLGSGLTAQAFPETQTTVKTVRRLAVHDRSPNFGLVEIDWERRVVSLQVRDDKGLTVLRHDVQF